MPRYLVTGAAGFIGSSLVRALLDRGEQVRGLDNFATGKRENLTEVIRRMDFREVDILDLEATRQACAGVDFVLHQAAIPSVPKSVLDPVGSNRANVDGTLNVLVAARDAKRQARGLCRLLFRLWGYTHPPQARGHEPQSDLPLRRGQAGR